MTSLRVNELICLCTSVIFQLTIIIFFHEYTYGSFCWEIHLIHIPHLLQLGDNDTLVQRIRFLEGLCENKQETYAVVNILF